MLQKRAAEKKKQAEASLENSLTELDLKVELQFDKTEQKEIVLRKSMDNSKDLLPQCVKE